MNPPIGQPRTDDQRPWNPRNTNTRLLLGALSVSPLVAHIQRCRQTDLSLAEVFAGSVLTHQRLHDSFRPIDIGT